MNLHSRKNKKWNLTTRYLLPSVNLSSNQFSLELLEILGFVNCYIEDEKKSIDNCLLLVFQPSKEMYESEKWTYFMAMITKKDGLIEVVEYDLDNRIFGFWLKIWEKFGDNLIFTFKKGKYSLFSDYYKQFLSPHERGICKKDKLLQYKKELDLGLNEGYLDNIELESIPDNEDLKFTLNENI